MKFRELRIHLLKAHGIPNVSISCTEKVSGKDCGFYCGKTLDCFLEHMKVVHYEMFRDGTDSIFDDFNGFELLVNEDTVRSHTEVCSIVMEERRKEKLRECKDRWVKKYKSKKENTHTTSDGGAVDVPAKVFPLN
jgi:hypothetical protein